MEVYYYFGFVLVLDEMVGGILDINGKIVSLACLSIYTIL
jgi:hypothetical protein